MRVLIAGGTGLVGTGLANALVAEGHTVSVTARHPQKASTLDPRVERLSWDGQSTTGWGSRLDGADAVVNLAGETLGGTSLGEIFFQRWTASKKREIVESRLNAGRAIVEAVRAARRKPSVLVQMSAVGFYGPRTDREIDETASPGTDFLAHVCQDWERSTEGVEDLGVRRVVVRTGLVLSPRADLFRVILLPFRFFVGGPLGSGRQGFSWVHGEDHRRALQFLVAEPRAAGVFNLTAPEPVTNAEMGRALARALHRPYWFPVPGFLLRLVLGEKSTLVLDGQRVVPQRLLDQGFSFRFPDIGSAAADLLV
ncbi:MAG TPA: TIGR01777 family oxidoreductase [Anaerolineales bacterium]|nr:TIGR01777 family oxidoreductase [Anaerolineales bacterium]